MTRILPLLLSCILSFWNSGADTANVGINANLSALTFQAGQKQDFKSDNQHAELTITGDPSVRVWTVIGGVEFEAVEPSSSWSLPFDGGTGIMLANPGAATTLHFTIKGGTIDVPFSANISVAFFIREAYGRAFTGNLAITSDAPIGVWAAECTDVACVGAPVQRF